jgi:hypothetical protein
VVSESGKISLKGNLTKIKQSPALSMCHTSQGKRTNKLRKPNQSGVYDNISEFSGVKVQTPDEDVSRSLLMRRRIMSAVK